MDLLVETLVIVRERSALIQRERESRSPGERADSPLELAHPLLQTKPRGGGRYPFIAGRTRPEPIPDQTSSDLRGKGHSIGAPAEHHAIGRGAARDRSLALGRGPLAEDWESPPRPEAAPIPGRPRRTGEAATGTIRRGISRARQARPDNRLARPQRRGVERVGEPEPAWRACERGHAHGGRARRGHPIRAKAARTPVRLPASRGAAIRDPSRRTRGSNLLPQ